MKWIIKSSLGHTAFLSIQYIFTNSSQARRRVLFIIDADPNAISLTPYADITDCSANKDEPEVLFMIGSVFRLNTIQQANDNGPLWKIRMRLSGDNENYLNPLSERMKKDYGGRKDIATSLALADVLREMQNNDLAINIYITISYEIRPYDPSIPGFV